MKKGISIGQILTRDAMKNINGGKDYGVSCSAAPGYHQESPGTCSGTRSSCQAAADRWCSDSPHCIDLPPKKRTDVN